MENKTKNNGVKQSNIEMNKRSMTSTTTQQDGRDSNKQQKQKHTKYEPSNSQTEAAAKA